MKSKVRVGNPPKHKAVACDTRGQCSLAISVVGQNQKPKESASQANALQKKKTIVLNKQIYTISFEVLHDIQDTF